MAASSSRAPGKKRASIAKPCSMVGAREGRRTMGERSPVRRSNRSALAALALHRPQPCRTGAASRAGSPSATASSTSARVVASPRFGATPVRIQALRFWYMRPRVPSMGSTITRKRAADSAVPRGRVKPPPARPSAIRTSGLRGAISRSKKSTRHFLAHPIDGVDRVAFRRLLGHARELGEGRRISHVRTTASRIRSWSARMGRRSGARVIALPPPRPGRSAPRAGRAAPPPSPPGTCR